MKSVFLSVVVICALTVAGIGGTLAGFSDTEESLNNYFEVGNLDLTVTNGGTTEFQDPNVPALVYAGLVKPCISQDFDWDIHNNSDGNMNAYAYICFKNYECYEAYTTKHPEASGRPEPEVVAEDGGRLANRDIDGMGIWGQNCTLDKFVEINVEYTLPGAAAANLIGTETWSDFDNLVYLDDLWPDELEDECSWIYIGKMPACNTWTGKMHLHISNWSEEMWNARQSTDINVFENNDLPFNDWLTNLFMNDGVKFAIDFALTQDQIPASACLYQADPQIGNPLPAGTP
jgi:predicted ribosomally synthesized peptide with SipW-like signal peptide